VGEELPGGGGIHRAGDGGSEANRGKKETQHRAAGAAET
jgi:hypothetical protein